MDNLAQHWCNSLSQPDGTDKMSFRTFAALALSIPLIACAQRQPVVRTAANDCFSRISGRSYEYILLGFGNPYIDAMLADDRLSREKSDFPSVTATATYQLKLVVMPEDLTVRPSINWEQAKMKADAWNRKLDEIEARIEAGKAQMGECFGEGYYGKQGAKKYANAKNSVAKTRTRVSEYTSAVKSTSEKAQEVEQWRARNIRYLKRRAGNMQLEIVKVAKQKFYSSTSTQMTIAATNITSSTILKPRNYRVWGYDVHPKLGGSTPIGTSMSDSFGNPYKLTRVSPKFLGIEPRGIRPGETKIFELEFGDVPLESAKFIRLSVDPGAYGQNQGVTFNIPADTFFRGMVQK